MEYVLIAVVAWIAFAWAIKGTAMLLFKLFPSLRPDPQVQRQRWLARKEAKARKKKAASPSKKKRGPIGGSHTAEIMMLGEDPVNRWAARKVRDKFF